MLADQTRVNAYLRALKNSIKPGCLVLEIGTGIGTFAIEAARLGAGQFFAIELEDAIQVAQQLAINNGLADRITFVRGLSTTLELPRPADVIVSDLHGALPFFQQHIPSIIDARTRLLRPGGILIPKSDTVWAVPVESSELYDNIALWDELSLNLDLSIPRRIVTNTWWKGRAQTSEFLSEPQRWATLDHTSIQSPDAKAEIEFDVVRPGTVHGWSMWFDTILDDAETLSNHPGKPELVYSNAFFPIEKPTAVVKGDRVRLRIRADLVEDDYVFGWNTIVLNNDGKSKAEYRQSTFFGIPRSRSELLKQDGKYKPALGLRGQLQNHILSLMDGANTNDEIAQAVMRQFPDSFSSFDKALFAVTTVARRYGK
jgi:protein arginine N-methyltransferase 1